MSELDTTDRKILGRLDHNCRQPVKQIASTVKLSPDAVHYRIDKLEAQEYITGYIPIIDYTKLGHQIIRLYLKLQNTSPEQDEEILASLQDQDDITIIYEIDGHYDIALGVLTPNVRAYDDTYHDILTSHREFIADTEFSIFKDYVQYYRAYLHDDAESGEIHTGSFNTYDYDTTDLRILRALTENATKSLLDIGEELDIPATTAKYRMKQLEKQGVIVAYRAKINYLKLGYEYYKVDLILEDLSVKQQLRRFAQQHPNIIYRDTVIGGSNFEFDCELPSQQQFYDLTETLRERFPIRTHRYYKAKNIIKHEYFPKLLIDDARK